MGTCARIAGKLGFAPAIGYRGSPNRTLTLLKATRVSGVVKNREGQPIANARVQLGVVSHPNKGTQWSYTSWSYVSAETIQGTPLEPFFITTTDPEGKFVFTAAPANTELIFKVSAVGYGDLDTAANGPKDTVYSHTDAGPVALVLDPEGRIDGRVVSRVPVSPLKDCRYGPFHFYMGQLIKNGLRPTRPATLLFWSTCSCLRSGTGTKQ